MSIEVGADQLRLGAREAQALDDPAPARRLRVRGRRRGPQPPQRRERDEEGERVGAVGDREARGRDQHAGQRRAAEPGGVAHRAVERAGRRQLAALDQPRHERVERRPQDRHEAGQQRRGDVERPHVRVGERRVGAQRERDGERAELRADHQPPAVERVGQRAAEQRQRDDRDELRRADEADRHRAAGLVVHLHGDRDERDRRAEQGHALPDHQQPQLAAPPQQVGVDRDRAQRAPQAAQTAHGAALGGRAVQRLDRARLADRVLAAEPRRAALADRAGEVVELARVRVGGLDRDLLGLGVRAQDPHRGRACRATGRARRSCPSSPPPRCRRGRARRSAQSNVPSTSPPKRSEPGEPRVDAVAAVDELGRHPLRLAREQPQRAHAVAADVHQRPALELARPAHVVGARGRA